MLIEIKKIAALLILMLFMIPGFAQKGATKKADKKFEAGEYEVAIPMYKKVKGGMAGYANFMIGESYRLSNRLNQAEPYYRKATEMGYSGETLPYFYAMSIKANGNYSEAKRVLESFVATSQNFELKKKGETEIDNLDELEKIEGSGSFYEIKNFEQLNTPYAEYAPVYNKGNVYISSSREGGKVYKATGQSFSNIYQIPFSEAGADLSKLEPLPSGFNGSDTNDGTIAFSPDGKTMVFAKGNTGKRKGGEDVDLYISTYRNGQWTEPRKMTINDPKAWDSTPAFNRNGRRLYFASNRDPNYGGTDIFYATRDANGRWGNVKNLGNEINTAGNEMFPYVNRDGKLYFSSTGHAGMGGLDLFRAERSGGKTEIINLGTPINSNYDDFGISYAGPLNGFFTSNRPDGMGDDDIYTFVNHDPDYKIVNYILAGKTTTLDKNEEVILKNVRVRLLDAEGNLLERTTTREDGTFEFRVQEESMYFLVGEKPDYFTTRELYSTMGKGIPKEELTKFETTVRFDTLLKLNPIEIDKAIVLENIYYDLDKFDIRPDAAVELDKLVAILADNPEISIELSSHTDSRANDDYNLTLSQNRAESAVNYIISKGIDPSRITAKGYGETQLIVSDARIEAMPSEEDKEAAHQRNRRTEFKVTSYNRPPEIKEDDQLEDKLFDN